MANLRKQIESASLHAIFERVAVAHSKDWPIKSGSFVVSTILDHRFANMAEDALLQRFGAFTEVDCAPGEAEGSTRINYRLDYSSFEHEQSPEADILIDPEIELAS